jgi:hypothetical protein
MSLRPGLEESMAMLPMQWCAPLRRQQMGRFALASPLRAKRGEISGKLKRRVSVMARRRRTG